jgi:hypothetical protein
MEFDFLFSLYDSILLHNYPPKVKTVMDLVARFSYQYFPVSTDTCVHSQFL